MPKPYISLPALLICAAMGGCDNAPLAPSADTAAPETVKTAADESSKVNSAQAPTLANPAAEFCEKMGGQYALAAPGEGSHDEKGECHLPNGKVVDAWTLYRAHAKAVTDSASADAGKPVSTEPVSMPNPAAEYCEKIGGKYLIKQLEGETGMCQLADGTTMNAWDLFRSHHKAQ